MHSIAETFHQTSYLTHWIFIFSISDWIFLSISIFVEFLFHIIHHLPHFIQSLVSLNVLKSNILSSLSGISSNSLSFDVIVRLIIFGGVNVLYFNVYACVHVAFVGYCIEILYIWYCFIASFIFIMYYTVEVFAVLKWDLDVVEMSV